MAEKVLYNGSCYAPFLIKVGMKREETYDKEEQKVFDFADKDGNGILNCEEYNRAVCCSGIYPGFEKQSNSPDYEEKFNNIDTNKNGKISQEELEEYIKVETKKRLIQKDFETQNDNLAYHDKTSSFILSALGIGAICFGKYAAGQKLPSANKCAELGIKLRFPKLHDIFNSCGTKLSKLGVAAGLLIAAAGICDTVMANNIESKRKKLMIESSDKMYAIIEENPQSEYAKKCYKEQEDYFANLSDRTEVSLESIKKELERLPKELGFWK